MKIQKGDVAVVTGVSRGLGVHIARALAARGLRLVLVARSQLPLDELAAALRAAGAEALVLAEDLGDPAAPARIEAAAMARYGRIDILINNAGADHAQCFDRIEPRQMERLLDINLAAPMRLTRALLPGMIARCRGHVVNIASIAGVMAGPYEEPYVAAKHGLVGFTRALRMSARELGWPVGVSAICPGFMEDAGIYADMQREYDVSAPRSMGSLPAAALGAAVLECIERDRPLRYLMRGTPRLAAALQLLWPRFYEGLATKLDTAAPFRKVVAARSQGRGI